MSFLVVNHLQHLSPFALCVEKDFRSFFAVLIRLSQCQGVFQEVTLFKLAETPAPQEWSVRFLFHHQKKFSLLN